MAEDIDLTKPDNIFRITGDDLIDALISNTLSSTEFIKVLQVKHFSVSERLLIAGAEGAEDDDYFILLKNVEIIGDLIFDSSSFEGFQIGLIVSNCIIPFIQFNRYNTDLCFFYNSKINNFYTSNIEKGFFVFRGNCICNYLNVNECIAGEILINDSEFNLIEITKCALGAIHFEENSSINRLHISNSAITRIRNVNNKLNYFNLSDSITTHLEVTNMTSNGKIHIQSSYCSKITLKESTIEQMLFEGIEGRIMIDTTIVNLFKVHVSVLYNFFWTGPIKGDASITSSTLNYLQFFQTTLLKDSIYQLTKVEFIH